MDIGTGMGLAIAAAKRAQSVGLRPFGSVIVDGDDRVLGIAGGSETATNPTRHSEMVAIKMACWERAGLLYGCTLFQTHEPCMGCCGFILHAKLARVVVGSMRSDLPQLFRQRDTQMHDLLADTSNPPFVVAVGSPILGECVALFDDEVDAVVSLPRAGR